MQSKVIQRPDVTVLELQGKLDITTAQIFETEYKKLGATKPRRVGLDLNRVEYIDSSGIGAIVKFLNLLKNTGGELILFGMNPVSLNVFKMAKLDSFFKILSSEDFEKKFPAS